MRLCHLCLLIILGAYPSSRVAMGGDIFSQLDTNSDGVLSGNEAMGLMPLDSSGDGEVTKSEFNNGAKDYQTRTRDSLRSSFATRDGNRDGRLSGSELKGVDFADENGDQRVTEAEYDAVMKKVWKAYGETHSGNLRETIAERFRMTDANADGRLSGNELLGYEALDRDQDGRITESEYLLGSIMICALSDADDGKDIVEELDAIAIVKLFVDAIETENDAAVLRVFRPELTKLVDEPILDYSFSLLKSELGAVKNPKPESIKQLKAAGAGEVTVNAAIPCDQGKFTLHLTIASGQVLGFRFDSPAMEKFGAALATDLLATDKGDKLSERFADYYGPRCRELALTILQGKDEEALRVIHPEIVKQVTKEKFVELFDSFRNSVGEHRSTTLESFGASQEESGATFLDLEHILTGTKGAVLFKTRFQLVGLKAALVSLTVSPAPTPEVAPEGEPKEPESKDVFLAAEDGVRFLAVTKPSRKLDENANVVMWSIDSEKTQYALQIHTFKEEVESGAKDYFVAINKQLVDNFGAKISSQEEAGLDGHPGQVELVRIGEGYIARRDILVGNKVYVLMVTAPLRDEKAMQELASPFLASLELVGEKKKEARPRIELIPPAWAAPTAAAPTP